MLLGAAVLSLVSCSRGEDLVPLGEPSGCDPLVPERCALPWPSGLFQEPDEAMPSGLRLVLSDHTLPVTTDGIQLRPDAYADKDGYSTLSPLLAWFGEVDLEGTIGHDAIEAYLEPGAKTVIVDVQTGERVPHFVELDMSAREGERVLILRPAVPLRHGAQHVVGIRGLSLAGGGPVPVSPAFAALRDGHPTRDVDVESRRDVFESVVFPALARAGVARDQLQLAWQFTTISRDNALGRVLWLRDDVLARVGSGGPPYTLTEVEEGDCSVEGEHIARTVYGTFTSPLYTDVDEPGGVLTRGPDGMPVYNGDKEVDFMVRIPCSLVEEPGTGGRVIQYGHGLLGSLGEGRSGYLSELIDANRWVLISQNWTGMSELDALYIPLMLAFDPSDFHTIPDRTQQGFSEWIAGLRMILGDLAADDALASGGSPVIDTALEPVYYGNSQGAILGGAYLALSTDLRRGALGVGGMPYSLLLPRSADFEPFLEIFRSTFADGRDIALLIAAIQTLWDPGESAGFASAILDPLPGTPSKQVLMQVAVGDAQVHTLGAHIAARAFGASSVSPGVRPIWGIAEQQAPFEGSALVEWRYSDGPEEPHVNVPPDKAMDPHECPRREPAAQAQLTVFLETGVVEQFCDGPCEGTRAGLCD
ncbi:MAG TPA: hypothetical protein ENK18_14280 [Deltaproteobacteria bacterium]|nr:hypothetical protein [Deltaproteobacteria bacterium]